jgi:hypothetical protein
MRPGPIKLASLQGLQAHAGSMSQPCKTAGRAACMRGANVQWHVHCPRTGR